MIAHRGSILLFAILLSASVGTAAIIPSWRVNAIPPPGTGGPPFTPAISFSLMVELTGGTSGISGGGLDFSGSAFIRYYQWRRFNADALDRPTPDEMVMFPQAAFDTYSNAPITGPLNGDGPPLRAISFLEPPFGDDRVGSLLNVQFGSMTGGSGLMELMRFTLVDASLDPFGTTIPLEFGRITDSTGQHIGLPPLPLRIVFPEPQSLIGILSAVLLLRTPAELRCSVRNSNDRQARQDDFVSGCKQ